MEIQFGVNLGILLKVSLNHSAKNGFLLVVTIQNNTHMENTMQNMNRKLVKLLIVLYVLYLGLIDKQTEAQKDL